MEEIEPNWIVLSIQPDESMHIELQAKEPGLDMSTRTLQLHASFRDDNQRQLGAYESAADGCYRRRPQFVYSL